jgi:VanZ family protein
MLHADAPEKSRLRIAVGLSILIAYSGLILAVTLSPTQLDVNYQNAVLRLLEVLHRNGIPSWFGYGEVEFLANVGMFIPFGFLVALLLPQRLSILTILIGPGFSAFIENFQREFLSERVASVYDEWPRLFGLSCTRETGALLPGRSGNTKTVRGQRGASRLFRRSQSACRVGSGP